MRTEQHSRMGMASVVLAVIPILLLMVVYQLMLLHVNRNPGSDVPAFAFIDLGLSLLTALAELVALALGIAGTLQRRSRRLLAFLGMVCSMLALAYIYFFTSVQVLH